MQNQQNTTSSNLGNFLKALYRVRDDLKCVHCSKLCRNPLTLSQCFHIMCSEHYKNLKECPECNKSFDGRTYSDPGIQESIEAVKKLEEEFKVYESNLAESPASPRKRIRKQEANENVNTTNENVASSSEKLKSNKNVTSSSEKLKSNKNVTSSSEKQKSNKNVTSSSEKLNLTNSITKINKALEKPNKKGETALHVACRLGKIEKVTELLNNGANVNTKDNAGWTPLHEVVQNGRLEIVKLLLQHNALINVPGPSNETPLHEAVRYNHETIAQELIMHGADVNIKNCKGETPSDLAKGNMQDTLELASHNIIQTQGFNISLISNLQTELDFEDIRLFCMSQYKTVYAKIKLLSKHHSNVRNETIFGNKVTHLIVDTEDEVCTTTLETLQAIVNHVWILNTDWVMKSTEEKLRSFEDYEVRGVRSPLYNGPYNSRYNRYKQLPGLFNGCHFYFHNFNVKYDHSKCLSFTKQILTKLVTDAGGVVLRRVPNPESIPESEKLVPYHADKNGKLAVCSHYIIFKDNYQPMYNMRHLKALPISWFVECIERYELCDP